MQTVSRNFALLKRINESVMGTLAIARPSSDAQPGSLSYAGYTLTFLPSFCRSISPLPGKIALVGSCSSSPACSPCPVSLLRGLIFRDLKQVLLQESISGQPPVGGPSPTVNLSRLKALKFRHGGNIPVSFSVGLRKNPLSVIPAPFCFFFTRPSFPVSVFPPSLQIENLTLMGCSPYLARCFASWKRSLTSQRPYGDAIGRGGMKDAMMFEWQLLHTLFAHAFYRFHRPDKTCSGVALNLRSYVVDAGRFCLWGLLFLQLQCSHPYSLLLCVAE